MNDIIAWFVIGCFVWGFCDLAWMLSGLIMKAVRSIRERQEK